MELCPNSFEESFKSVHSSCESFLAYGSLQVFMGKEVSPQPIVPVLVLIHRS